MKKLLNSALLLLAIVSFYSCLIERPISKLAPDNNQSYRVEYLFEHDGCKVYRFWDHGNYVYFTNCSNSVTSISNDSIQTKVNSMIFNKGSK
jgi:hypothetical protein